MCGAIRRQSRNAQRHIEWQCACRVRCRQHECDTSLSWRASSFPRACRVCRMRQYNTVRRRQRFAMRLRVNVTLRYFRSRAVRQRISRASARAIELRHASAARNVMRVCCQRRGTLRRCSRRHVLPSGYKMIRHGDVTRYRHQRCCFVLMLAPPAMFHAHGTNTSGMPEVNRVRAYYQTIARARKRRARRRGRRQRQGRRVRSLPLRYAAQSMRIKRARRVCVGVPRCRAYAEVTPRNTAEQRSQIKLLGCC